MSLYGDDTTQATQHTNTTIIRRVCKRVVDPGCLLQVLWIATSLSKSLWHMSPLEYKRNNIYSIFNSILNSNIKFDNKEE